MWQIGFVEKFPEHGIVFRSERREKGIPERQMMIYINCSHFTTIWKQKESFLRNSFEVWEVFIYLESLCCKPFAAKFKRKQFQLLSTQSHSQSTIFQFAIMSQRIFIHHRSFFEKKRITKVSCRQQKQSFMHMEILHLVVQMWKFLHEIFVEFSTELWMFMKYKWKRFHEHSSNFWKEMMEQNSNFHRWENPNLGISRRIRDGRFWEKCFKF